MKLLKFILPITALLMVFVVVESTAQICVFKEGEEYRLEDAIKLKGDNLKFIKFCCDQLNVCTANYLAYDKYYLTHTAAKYNRCDVLKYLVEDQKIPYDRFPININTGKNELTQTQIMMSSENGSLEAVQYLVEKAGVRVTRQNDDGRDTLYYAKKSGSKKMIDYVQSKWNKEMGYSQMLIEQEKAKLRNLLKPEAIQKHFAQNTVIQTTKPYLQSVEANHI